MFERNRRGGDRRTRALVTGGAGFIGSHLSRALLDDDCRVTVVDNLSSGLLHNVDSRATFYHAELNDARLEQIVQRERPELVFHLAAQSSVRRSTADPVADADSNVTGTIRLLAAAAAAGVDKVIYSSTGGAINGNPDAVPCAEDAPPCPQAPYALSKYVAEQYLELYNRTYGLDYTVLRYANVYGPGQDPDGEAGVVAIFAGAMLGGRRPQIYGDGGQERDFIYVDDAVAANLAAMGRGRCGTYNIGAGVPVSVNRICELLREITGCDREPEYRPRRSGEVRSIALDSSRAGRELRWTPRVPLEEGLRRTVEHLRAELAPRSPGLSAKSSRRRRAATDR